MIARKGFTFKYRMLTFGKGTLALIKIATNVPSVLQYGLNYSFAQAFLMYGFLH